MIRRALPGLWATIFLLPHPAQISAQQSLSATAARTAVTPVLDGVLNDSVWQRATVMTGMVQTEPFEGRPVSERTEVRMLYDDAALYVGAWLFDSGELVVGRTLRDAALTDSDAFVLILDTYHDRQNGFVFGTSPAGIEYDAQVVNEGASVNVNWNGNWQVATSRDTSGWYVEMRIPFSTLRYARAGPQTWGLNFERRIRRNSEQAVWAPLPRQLDINRVSMAGTLALETPVRRVMTVSPYALADLYKDYRVTTPEADTRARVGGDAKIGIAQNLILDVTVNTDFAQAEVDEQQINLTRFSLFFPEKRAFFLENAGLFATGTSRTAELFFSRRIGLAAGQEVPIRGGGRITGRVAGLQVGLLNIQTAALEAENVLTGALQQVAPPNNFGVLRIYRESPTRSRIGAIATTRINTNDPDDRSLTFGVDGRLAIGQDFTFDAWAAVTETPSAAAETRTGFADGEYAFSGAARYVSRDWQLSAEYRQIGDEFNPEVGFVNRLGYRHANARVLRHLRTPDIPWFREFRPHVSWNQFWNLDGFMQSYLVHFDNHFAFHNGAFFQLPGLNLTGEGLEQPFEIRDGIAIPAGTYHNVDWEFRANTNRGAPLSLSGGWDWGGFYSGTRFGPTATVAYRSGDRIAVSLQGNWFDVRLAEGSFTTAVFRFTGSYSFSPRIFLQSSIQYNDDIEDLSSNIRLTFLERGGSGLFLVYNDAQHLGSIDRTGIAAGPRQRQVVVKYSRLLDLSR
jgi:hypothetical protein